MKIVKKKIEIYVTEEWKEKIQSRASESGISMAEVIKRAIEQYLK